MPANTIRLRHDQRPVAGPLLPAVVQAPGLALAEADHKVLQGRFGQTESLKHETTKKK